MILWVSLYFVHLLNTHRLESLHPMIPKDLHVNKCLWSRKLSFVQWQRKH